MNDKFIGGFSFDLMLRSAAEESLVRLNEVTEKYGLRLTRQQAAELLCTRESSLKGTGRVEVGLGAVEKIVRAFCDCPYLWRQNYAEMLNDLVEIFYYMKNETLDEVGDDELIALMRDYFENRCGGSIELLVSRELEQFARNIRFANSPEEEEQEEEEGEEF